MVSSNSNKLLEFQRLGLEQVRIEKGRDLQEVKADPITVVLYKAREAGIHRIVEDTSFDCEGADIGVDIKWKLNELKNLEFSNATWRVLLGVHEDEVIQVFEGVIKGQIVTHLGVPDDAFGFDSLFMPNGSDMTLYELAKEGRKDNFSARRLAVEALLSKQSVFTQKVDELKEWNGEFQ